MRPETATRTSVTGHRLSLQQCWAQMPAETSNMRPTIQTATSQKANPKPHRCRAGRHFEMCSPWAALEGRRCRTLLHEQTHQHTELLTTSALHSRLYSYLWEPPGSAVVFTAILMQVNHTQSKLARLEPASVLQHTCVRSTSWWVNLRAPKSRHFDTPHGKHVAFLSTATNGNMAKGLFGVRTPKSRQLCLSATHFHWASVDILVPKLPKKSSGDWYKFIRFTPGPCFPPQTCCPIPLYLLAYSTCSINRSVELGSPNPWEGSLWVGHHGPTPAWLPGPSRVEALSRGITSSLSTSK